MQNGDLRERKAVNRQDMNDHGATELHDAPMTKENVTSNDRSSMLLLLLLYTLQGIPMGLCGSIPLIMKEKGTSYKALSLFSLVSLPFSLKILWAPVVDSIYNRKFGRRKSWLVPIQMLTGLFMIVGAQYVNIWMGDANENTLPDVGYLTLFFIFLYFLMATQDIAVDGWALTMLSRDSVGYASMCNSIGQLIGFFSANQGFIALSDSRWCANYLGLKNGDVITSTAGFMKFWGWVFIIITLLVWFFKHESKISDDEPTIGLMETCRQIFAIFHLPSIRKLTVILLTCRIAFAPVDAIFTFKLQENGMPKADIVTLSPIVLLVGMCLPAVTGHIVSSRPLEMILLGVPLKILMSIAAWFAIGVTKEAYRDDHTPGATFFVPLVTLMMINEIANTLVFISFMAFFSKISDPTIGGTYMTLLNTLTNLGSKWPNSLSLWVLPKMTLYGCQVVMDGVTMVFKSNADCSDQLDLKQFAHDGDVILMGNCEEVGGSCQVTLDGYTLQSIICVVIGIIWFMYFGKVLFDLQSLPHSMWCIQSSEVKGTNNLNNSNPFENGKDSKIISQSNGEENSYSDDEIRLENHSNYKTS